MEYELIRSRRRTIAAEIRQGKLLIRAPLRTTEAEVNAFLLRHREWVETHLENARRTIENAPPPLTREELEQLARQALQVIPQRVAYYAPLVGVSYGRITIRNQRTKWGSCSGKGNLNFNCLLMLAPPEVLDSVVVHELCHRKEMNHSEHFYAEVLRVFPEYRRWDRWLKENGAALMARMDLGNELS